MVPPDLQGVKEAKAGHPAGLTPGVEAGPQDDEAVEGRGRRKGESRKAKREKPLRSALQ